MANAHVHRTHQCSPKNNSNENFQFPSDDATTINKPWNNPYEKFYFLIKKRRVKEKEKKSKTTTTTTLKEQIINNKPFNLFIKPTMKMSWRLEAHFTFFFVFPVQILNLSSFPLWKWDEARLHNPTSCHIIVCLEFTFQSIFFLLLLFLLKQWKVCAYFNQFDISKK